MRQRILKAAGADTGQREELNSAESEREGVHENTRLAQVGPPSDPVETALADAITKAADASQWDAVAQLAQELKARREARALVVSLEAERARRGKGC